MNRHQWARQSLTHLRHLVETIGPRGSATTAERAAARYVEAELVKLGVPVTVQRFRSPTSAWRPFACVWLIAIVAAVLAPLATPFTGVLAAALSLLALWWLMRELNLYDTPLRRLLPQGDSQNVIGRMPPLGPTRQKVVLVGHLDSHRTPYFHQTQKRNATLARLLILAAVGLIVNAVVFLLVAFTAWNWLYLATLPFSLLHLVGLIISLQADTTPYSPGASDNASAVATVLTLAGHLSRRPLLNTELWFLFSGCEEVGCYGMRAFIDANRDELVGAIFIDYEMVARGEPGILTHEGLLTRVAYDPELIQLAADAAAAVWRPAHLKIGAAYGESVISHGAGYRSITVNAMLPETGEPVAWHRPDDDMRVVDETTLGHVAAWGLEILRRLDL